MLIWDGRQNSGLYLYHVKKLVQCSGDQRTRDNWKSHLGILMVEHWVVTALGCNILCFDSFGVCLGVFEVRVSPTHGISSTPRILSGR